MGPSCHGCSQPAFVDRVHENSWRETADMSQRSLSLGPNQAAADAILRLASVDRLQSL